MNAEWRQRIAAGVKRAKQLRASAGLLSANDLAAESGFPRGTIISFMDHGALACLEIGSRRYVERTVWKRFRKALAQGGANAAA
jgi:hypothetical protein